MNSRILLTSLAVTIMAASSASAQQPTSGTQPKPKPAVQQTKQVAAAKTVAQPKTVQPASQPKKLQLKEAQPGLTSQAKVSLENALATAQKSYPGTVVSERIEKLGDQLVYRFGIRSNKKIHHVFVDAKTGAVVKPQAHATSHVKPGTTEK